MPPGVSCIRGNIVAESFALADCTIAYTWHGAPSPAPLVMLHGLGDSAIVTLGSLFETDDMKGTTGLLVDVPGFGLSTATDTYSATIERHAHAIAKLLAFLGVRDATLFGHSMGANIGLLLAHGHPGLIARLALAEPLLDARQSTLAAHVANFTESAFLLRGHAMLVRATRIQAMRGDQVAQQFLETLVRADSAAMHRSATSLLAQRTPTFREILAERTQPVTLLVGDQSRATISPADAGGRSIITIANAGHALHIQQPQATARAILTTIG